MDDEPRGLEGHFKATSRTLLAYVQARMQLLAVEVREASHVLGERAVYVAVGAAFVLLGYILLLTALISILADRFEVAWHWVCLGLALLHLLPGGILLAVSRSRFPHPLFHAILHEFDKDREWLTHSKNKRQS